MESLNNDCLLEIFQYLDLRDHLSLYEASSNLQMAVRAVWRKNFKDVYINFSEFFLTDEEFEIFLRGVEETVEKFHFRFLTKEKYEVFKKFCFERVHDFEFSIIKPFFLEDSDLYDMQRIMPNLKSFTPHGNFTGNYMANWTQLVDLTLSYCIKIDSEHFKTIINTLKLEKLKLNLFPNTNRFEQILLQNAQLDNLKYLELNTYELYYFMSKPLTALKELIVANHYNSRQLFDVLLSVWQAKDILRVETANVNNILLNCIEMKFNVEELSIVNDGNPFPSSIIPSIPLLTNLRKLSFKSCAISTKCFIDLLKNIPQLTEISFENCLFDVSNIYLTVDELFPYRNHKLTINMCGNRLIDSTGRLTWPQDIDHVIFVYLEIKGSRRYLEMTHESKQNKCYEPLYVLFR